MRISKISGILTFLLFLFLSVSATPDIPPYGIDEWNKKTTGNHTVLVVIVNFNDFKNLTSINDITRKLDLLREFYFNNSYGSLNLSFDLKFVNLTKNMGYYGADGGFGNTSWKRIDELGYKYHHYGEDFSYQHVFPNDVLKILDNEVNFMNYDHIIFVHSYYDQANHQECKDCLWSIYIPYINFTTNDYYYWNWEKFYAYVNYGICVSEDDNLGVIAHEFGHELGLPDLYNIETGESVVGIYDLMDSGAWFDENFGAFSKFKLGFSRPFEINETNLTSLTLNLSNFHDSFIKINVNPWKYFLIEYRNVLGNNTFLIWEVNEDMANNTEERKMVYVYNFSKNLSNKTSFKKYSTSINFTLFEDFAKVNISNHFFEENINRVVEINFCTKYNSYEEWPENCPQNFSWCEDERNDKNFLKNETMFILMKLNLNPNDNVTVSIYNSSSKILEENFTYTKKRNKNLYNMWNWMIDNIILSVNLSDYKEGEYILDISVNDEVVYSENFEVVNKSDEVPYIDANINENYGESMLLEIKIADNVSDVWIDYWDEKICKEKSCRKNYRLSDEELKKLNENKSIVLKFYGNFYEKYCFQVYAKNKFQNSNFTRFCSKMCPPLTLDFAFKVIQNIENDECYDVDSNNEIDVFDVVKILEKIKDG